MVWCGVFLLNDLFLVFIRIVLAEKVRVRILGFVSLLGFRMLIECLENALK